MTNTINNREDNQAADWSPAEIEDADQAAALLAKYDPTAGAPELQRIGGSARTLKEARTAGQFWSNLDRDNGLAAVTLDTDPEVKGRPQSMRPGVPQLKLIELPDWHHLHDSSVTASQIAVVYYVPVTTWVATDSRLDGSGRVVSSKKVLASGRDASGYQVVTAVERFSSHEAVDEFAAELRSAVRALAGSAEFDPDVTDIEGLDEEDAQALREKMRRLSAM